MATITTLINGPTLAVQRAAINANFAALNLAKMELVSVPASADASGTAGQFAFDDNYIYRCTATNTWVRAPLSFATWS